MVKKSHINKWIKALRSGEFKQTKRRLQDDKGYCCLGVACKLFIPEEKLYTIDKYILGFLPNQQFNSPDWLRYINLDFYDKLGFSLSNCNDKLNLTFDEIGDLLQLVYIEKALD